MAVPPLIAHLEHHFGEIERGYPVPGTEPPINIAEFSRGPFADTLYYASLGLSHHHLGDAGGPIRMELLMMLRRCEQSSDIPSLMAGVIEMILTTHIAPARGQVFGPAGPLWNDSHLQALYVTWPAYMPDAFASVELGDGDRCVFAWLVPITARETAYVRANGPGAFESALASENPDLLAPNRPDLHVVRDTR